MGELIQHLNDDLFGVAGAAGSAIPGSLELFRPELVICATILIILAVRIFSWGQKIDSFWLALFGVATALCYALPPEGFANLSEIGSHEIFTGLLVHDPLSVAIRSLLLFFALLFVPLTKLTGLTTKEEGPDFYCLVLGATLGFCIMTSANHLLAVFLGIEMASVPSYVMAGILKGRAKSSEAALKYAVYGAGAAGIMLYGISLLAGVLGSAHFPTLARQLVALDIPALATSGDGTQTLMVLALGGLMLMVGLAFKLSAVPFHFWCPDVFEGAPAEVGALLSVASKAAALALLLRVVVGLGYVGQAAPIDPPQIAMNVVADSRDPAAPAEGGLFSVADSTQSDMDKLAPVRSYMAMLLAFLAAITCTFGNLAAYGQTNIKRLLAYSTIAHAGYMIMPVAAAMALVGTDLALASDAIAALLLYITIYLFMNLGAFAIVAFLRGVLGSEEIEDYAGLVHAAPFTVICFTMILFSLVGIPPFAGFIGKFWVFYALVQAGGPIMMTLLVIAALNTAISLVYYLRVVKVMTIDSPGETTVASGLPFMPATYVGLVTAPVLILFVWHNDIYTWAHQAATQLFS